MACSMPPMYWSTGIHCQTFFSSNGFLASLGEEYRRKYQALSTKVSMVSVSLRALALHLGQVVSTKDFTCCKGFPTKPNSAASGSLTGSLSSGTGRSEEHTSELQSQFH